MYIYMYIYVYMSTLSIPTSSSLGGDTEGIQPPA